MSVVLVENRVQYTFWVATNYFLVALYVSAEINEWIGELRNCKLTYDMYTCGQSRSIFFQEKEVAFFSLEPTAFVLAYQWLTVRGKNEFNYCGHRITIQILYS
jgi:isocitrate dehydrogenase kinase/phosphatase